MKTDLFQSCGHCWVFQIYWHMDREVWCAAVHGVSKSRSWLSDWTELNWTISNPERWCCESAEFKMPANLETQQWPQDWKRSGFILIPKKDNAKECSHYHTIALISHASKVMFKILQARLQQYVNQELPDVQPGFRKGRGTRDQIANIHWIIEKAREFQKNICFCFIDYTKAFDCVDHNKLWKIL